MQVSKKQSSVINVIGKAQRFNLHDSKAPEKINLFWQQLQKQNVLGAIHNALDKRMFAVYTNYDDDGNYTLIIGASVGSLHDVPEGLVGLPIPEATYQVVTACGPRQKSVSEAWEYIWSTDFKAKRAFTFDYEVYDKRAKDPENAEVDIYVAVVE
jgi:Uncharacterized protein conserved in bacteria